MASYVCPDCLAEIADAAEQCDGCGFVRPSEGWLKDPLTGLILSGRYRLERRLGAGGMASVYRAARLGSLGGNVAVKLLAPRFARTVVGKRFEREAQVISQLTSPHIIRVYDYDSVTLPGTEQPLYYIAMELVVGRTLEAVLNQQGKVNFLWGVDVLRQTARGLDEAHQAGITHRDLKPANLMLVEHRNSTHVKILDFGIAALTEGHTSAQEKLTQTGFVSGTPDYMAPEQAIGSDGLGPPADIYALGIMAFEMFSGRRPFVGDTVMETLMKRVTGPAPRMCEACDFPGFPADLGRIVDTMLQREPHQRFPDAGALLDALQRFPSFQTSPDFAPPQEIQLAASRDAQAHPTGDGHDYAQFAPTEAGTPAALVASSGDGSSGDGSGGDSGAGGLANRSRRGLWLGLAGFVVAGGAAAGVLLSGVLDKSTVDNEHKHIHISTTSGAAGTDATGAVGDAKLAAAATPRPDSGTPPKSAEPDKAATPAPVALGYARPAAGTGWVTTSLTDGRHRWAVSVTEEVGALFQPRKIRVALDRAGQPLRALAGEVTVVAAGEEAFATVKGRGDPADGRLALTLPPFPAAGVYGLSTTLSLPDGTSATYRFAYDAGTGRIVTE